MEARLFDEPQLIVAAMAALAFAVVLIVFAISIRFINATMRGRLSRRLRLRFTRRNAPAVDPAENRHKEKQE